MSQKRRGSELEPLSPRTSWQRDEVSFEQGHFPDLSQTERRAIRARRMPKVVGGIVLATLALGGMLKLGELSDRSGASQANAVIKTSERQSGSALEICGALPTLVARATGPGAAALVGRGVVASSKHYEVSRDDCNTPVYAPDVQLGPAIGTIDSRSRIRSLGCVASGGRLTLTYTPDGDHRVITGEVYTDGLTFDQVEVPEICGNQPG